MMKLNHCTLKASAAAIRDIRKQAGLSQQALAELSQLSRTAIQNLESGDVEIHLSTLLSVCETLNITLTLHHPLLPFVRNNMAIQKRHHPAGMGRGAGTPAGSGA